MRRLKKNSMHDDYILRVSQLNEYVSNMLRRETLLQHIGVRGEISGFKRHSSGHLYFSLKDESALIRCVMFKTNAMQLSFTPHDGMQVVVSGNVSIFVRDGQYQLYAQSMHAEGEGELYRQFILMKNALAEEGLFDASHKKALPFLPRCIGVITSKTGAVIHDIENVTQRRFPQMPILLYPVPVQGLGAAERIAEGIREMNRLKKADVLIVGRGGGSMEDLWAFNEEVVARAIYESDIPVISAVGHETDETIADYAADFRAPTPSAAAELCVPEYVSLCAWLQDEKKKLLYYSQKRIEAERERIRRFADCAAMAGPAHRIEGRKTELRAQKDAIEREMRMTLMACAHKKEELLARLQSLSPIRVMQSGYALIRKETGYIGGAGELSLGDEIEILFKDGTARAKVSAVNERSDT